MADASLIGHESPEGHMPVERGKIAEFARATFSDRPIFTDPEAARQAGFRDVPAPPTFVVASAHFVPSDPGFSAKLDMKRILAGGAEWEFFRPLMAGDELTVRSRVVDVETKQGKRGQMTLITREVSYFDASGELVQRMRSTVIEMPPMEAKAP